MPNAQDIRSWLRAVLDERGISVAELARLAGVNKSTIFRALDDGYEYVPSSRTLDKLSNALGASSEIKSQIDSNEAIPWWNIDALPILQNIGKDIWVPLDSPPLGLSPLIYNERFPRDKQWVARVADGSAGREYGVGDLVHIANADVARVVKMKPNDHVILARYGASPLEHPKEYRIYEVLESAEWGMKVQAPALQPDFESRFELPPYRERMWGAEVDGVHIGVEGIVIGQYKHRHPLAG